MIAEIAIGALITYSSSIALPLAMESARLDSMSRDEAMSLKSYGELSRKEKIVYGVFFGRPLAIELKKKALKEAESANL
jgi:hypothetical protein